MLKRLNLIFFLTFFLAFLATVSSDAAGDALDKGKKKSVPVELKNVISQRIIEQNRFINNLAMNEVKIGTYILNIRKLDAASGTWTVDFYVWFVWNSKGNVNPENFEIMNGSRDNKDSPVRDDIEIEGKPYKWLAHRVHSDFVE